LTCAIYHAIDHNANIINISAGFRGEASAILEKAINTAREQEVFICTAAGNDGVKNDTLPQYPASYAGIYRYNYDDTGQLTDSLRYKNVISIAALKPNNKLVNFSNFGKNSVTMACYGHNLSAKGLDCNSTRASGTSFATFAVTRFLALEIAKDNTRSMSAIWNDFDSNKLTWGGFYLQNRTRTGKRLDVNINWSQNKVANSANEVIDKNSNEYELNFSNIINAPISVQIMHTSNEIAYLIYEIALETDIQINLYDANGKLVQNLVDETVYGGKHQATISKDKLKQGMYFVQILQLAYNGITDQQILKMAVLR